MDKKEFKLKLEAEIEKTISLIKEYQDLAAPVAPDEAIGRVSRMDAINNKSITEAALRQAEIKLSKLKVVLQSLDGESFGLCLKCKNQIPPRRILIRPESVFCVNCAQ